MGNGMGSWAWAMAWAMKTKNSRFLRPGEAVGLAVSDSFKPASFSSY
jgi:hypothetical protein